ncbi:PREDICTED: uncharacterized protein LOC105556341 [Vollenhovia emeryi]|uniref:uncharacterized protein LOC105556341 n=1 Tax=Vollenhovia emeryi TaxID=411798 RepID=UPI0005F36F68|nr:PREDICTED: uncharacterized protein LOC105556341 [Vollenhovia emeryi]
MVELGVPDYLRTLVGNYLSGRKNPAGTGKGSVLGPVLWDVAYNAVLEAALPSGALSVCYADDTLVLAEGETWEEAVATANVAVACIVRVIEGLGLRVAARKTEAVFLHNGKHGPPPDSRIMVGDTRIQVGSHIRYLGILLDGRLCFREHIAKLAPRLDAAANALSRLMPNLGGPSGRVRRLFANVVSSIALYGAPIWAEEVSANKKARATLQKVQRRMAIRATRAYRTVSHAAATLLAGIPPVDVLAGSYKWAYEKIADLKAQGVPIAARIRRAINAQAKKRAREAWKRRLAEPNCPGRRTVQAILPVMEGWLDRPWARASYRASQVLTGHGCFGGYLRRIGKEATAACHHCDEGCDDAQHTLEVCPAWAAQRSLLRGVVGEDLSMEAVVEAIVQRGWSPVAGCGIPPSCGICRLPRGNPGARAASASVVMSRGRCGPVGVYPGRRSLARYGDEREMDASNSNTTPILDEEEVRDGGKAAEDLPQPQQKVGEIAPHFKGSASAGQSPAVARRLTRSSATGPLGEKIKPCFVSVAAMKLQQELDAGLAGVQRSVTAKKRSANAPVESDGDAATAATRKDSDVLMSQDGTRDGRSETSDGRVRSKAKRSRSQATGSGSCVGLHGARVKLHEQEYTDIEREGEEDFQKRQAEIAAGIIPKPPPRPRRGLKEKRSATDGGGPGEDLAALEPDTLQRLLMAAASVRNVQSTSGNLKGTHSRALKDAAWDLEEIEENIRRGTIAGELNRLRERKHLLEGKVASLEGEVDRLRAELGELRYAGIPKRRARVSHSSSSDIVEPEAGGRAMRNKRSGKRVESAQPSPATTVRGGGGRAGREETRSGVVERMRAMLEDTLGPLVIRIVGPMLDARIDAIRDRLLPEQSFRPPLGKSGPEQGVAQGESTRVQTTGPKKGEDSQGVPQAPKGKCPVAAARKASAAGRILVGWVSARIEALEPRPLQCFKCHGLGHTKPLCKATVDRSSACFRCGVAGHRSAQCSEAPRCTPCADSGKPSEHRIGSTACGSAASRKGGKLAVGAGPSPSKKGKNRRKKMRGRSRSTSKQKAPSGAGGQDLQAVPPAPEATCGTGGGVTVVPMETDAVPPTPAAQEVISPEGAPKTGPPEATDAPASCGGTDVEAPKEYAPAGAGTPWVDEPGILALAEGEGVSAAGERSTPAAEDSPSGVPMDADEDGPREDATGVV